MNYRDINVNIPYIVHVENNNNNQKHGTEYVFSRYNYYGNMLHICQKEKWFSMLNQEQKYEAIWLMHD